MGTGFTGPSSLGRVQQPCLAAGMCQDDGTKIGFGTGWASALVSNSNSKDSSNSSDSCGSCDNSDSSNSSLLRQLGELNARQCVLNLLQLSTFPACESSP